MMNYELLNYLKLATDRDWLDCDASNLSTNQRSTNQKYTNILDVALQEKLGQISFAKDQHHRKLAVLLVASNPLEFIATFLASVIAEVHLFLGDPSWQKREWQQVLDLVVPDLVFGDDAAKHLINQLKSNRKHGEDLTIQRKIADPSLIMIPTGGTSGKIKFAIHNWSTLTASVTGFQNFFNCPKINSYCTLPLYHVSGLMQLMRSLLTQGDFKIYPYKSIVNQATSLSLSEYFISLVPTQLEFLIASNPNCLKRFKTILVGGAPPRRSLLEVARKHQLSLSLTYGMTETASGIVALKSQDFLAGNNSIGQVLPQAQVLINSSHKSTNNTQLEITENKREKAGLIQINSTSFCLGYYPQLFDVPQSFMTDDIGYFDNRGYLYLLGRNSQKIITGGEKVFPTEVEEAIYSTKLVQDICVLGIPDQKWGEAVTAIYVPLKSPSNLNLIKQKIRPQLAKYKQPKNWVAVETIPRNNRGKINYQQLQEIALQAMLEQNKGRF